MKSMTVGLLLIVTVCGAGSLGAQQRLAPELLVEKQKKLVGRIETGEAKGSGFIVAAADPQRCFFITARHNIAEKRSQGDVVEFWLLPDLKLKLPTQHNLLDLDARNISNNSDSLAYQADVAFIDLPISVVGKKQPLNLSNEMLYSTMEVWPITYPGGAQKSEIKKGIVKSYQEPFNIDFGGRVFEQGESGGAVINAKGAVVAMVVSRKDTANYIISAQRIRRLANKLDVLLKEPSDVYRVAVSDIGFHHPVENLSSEFISHLSKFMAHSDGRIIVDREDSFPDDAAHVRTLTGEGLKAGNSDLLFTLTLATPHSRKDIEFEKRVSASNVRNLADSAGVKLARHFGYEVTFAGPHYGAWKRRLPVSAVATVASVFLWSERNNQRTAYEHALTSTEASDKHGDVRLLENLGIPLTTLAAGSAVWAGFSLRKRKPVFEFVGKEPSHENISRK